MSPWSNYTFRVIARNKVGDSLPSGHSKTCLTPEAVPSKNPDNVEGRGTAPNNLVISWTVSEANAVDTWISIDFFVCFSSLANLTSEPFKFHEVENADKKCDYSVTSDRSNRNGF